VFVAATHTFLGFLHRLLFGEDLNDPHRNIARASLWALLVACLAFGYELSNPTLGVDDYLRLRDTDAHWGGVVKRGRWGNVVLHSLIPGGRMIPFLPLIVGLILQVLTIIIAGWVWSMSHAKMGRLLIPYCLYATFPYLACQMAFSFQQVTIPLSNVLVVMSVALAFADRKSWRLLLSPVLLAMGLSIYQGCLSVLGVVVALIPLFSWARGPDFKSLGMSSRNVIGLAFSIMFGAFLYFFVHSGIMWAADFTQVYDHYDVSPQLDFWNRIPSLRSAIVFLHLGGGNIIPELPVLCFLVVSVILVLSILSFRAESLWLRGVTCLSLAAAFFAPFCGLLIKSPPLPPRACMGLGLLWAAVFSLLYQRVGVPGRRMLTCVTCAVVLSFAFHINGMFFAQHLVSLADRVMMVRIIQRIDGLKFHDSKSEAIPVVMAGTYSHPEVAYRRHFVGSVIGYSNFEWARGAPPRMSALAESLGIPRAGYTFIKDQAVEEELAERGHPRWPHPESVFSQDSRVVVWLGPHVKERPVAPLEKRFRNLFR
jgi:hypothetical protein